MRTFAIALLVTSACLSAACGGDGTGDEPTSLRTPGAAAPTDVIAFGALGEDGDNALYSVRFDGTDLQELASEPANVDFPRWSPEGSRVAYVVAGGRGTGTKATLRIYDFDGGLTTTVTDHMLASGDEAPMAWSPDGTRIAFIEATGEDATGGTLRIYDLKDLQLLDQPTVPATSVAWSSEDEIAIVAPAEDPATTDVYTMAPQDDQARLLVTRDGLEGALAWSRDGNTLTFWGATSTDLAERTLFVLAANADEAKDVGPGLDPAWSNGGRIAYSRPATPGARGELDIYAADGVSPPVRLSEAITLDRWPSWSPARDRVVFLARADASTSFLCVASLDGEDEDCFDLPGLRPGAPAWSPY
jgi:Tol biopolymer transport system component